MQFTWIFEKDYWPTSSSHCSRKFLVLHLIIRPHHSFLHVFSPIKDGKSASFYQHKRPPLINSAAVNECQAWHKSPLRAALHSEKDPALIKLIVRILTAVADGGSLLKDVHKKYV